MTLKFRGRSSPPKHHALPPPSIKTSLGNQFIFSHVPLADSDILSLRTDLKTPRPNLCIASNRTNSFLYMKEDYCSSLLRNGIRHFRVCFENEKPFFHLWVDPVICHGTVCACIERCSPFCEGASTDTDSAPSLPHLFSYLPRPGTVALDKWMTPQESQSVFLFLVTRPGPPA